MEGDYRSTGSNDGDVRISNGEGLASMLFSVAFECSELYYLISEVERRKDDR